MYFESKAKDLLVQPDDDIFSRACANLLFANSPNIERSKIEKEAKLVK